MLTTVQHQTKKIKGPAGFINVEDYGSGGIPVVLTHSFGGSTCHWKNQIDHLSKNHRVIAFDFRGHGKSDPPADNKYSADNLAEDISAVVDHLGLDNFILVGHSMGGAAAIAYAGKNPKRVRGLVLSGTPGKTPEELSKQVIASLESDAYQKVMDEYMNKLLTNAKPEVNAMVSNEFKKIPKDASLNIIKSLFEFDPLPSLKKYNGLKLIIYSDGEEQPAALKNQVLDVPNKKIEGTSHWTQLDKPEEFNRVLDGFIGKVSTNG